MLLCVTFNVSMRDVWMLLSSVAAAVKAVWKKKAAYP
jgi:hypothetical protein